MSYSYKTQGFTVNDAGKRIVVDPVTRIEGHLRCEVNINEENVITNAVSCGTLFRGLEIILKGRDPREAWAFTERICGVCTGTHALASVQAVEDALNIVVPDNANIIRNLMQLSLWFHDHLVHFYQLGGLDWIDVAAAAKGDPVEASRIATSLSDWPQNSPAAFADVLGKLKAVLASGQLGIFKNGYWGHPGYKLSPDMNLLLLTHYLQALDFQKEAVKIHAVFGGKNPHPNWLVGGIPTAINVDGAGGADVINTERLELVWQVITRCKQFAEQVYMPDAMALAAAYPEWSQIGVGLTDQALLSFGAFPTISGDNSAKSLLIPRGAIINGNFDEILPVDLYAKDEVQEFISHSWYDYPSPHTRETGLHPFDGETDPNFTLGKNTVGTPTNIKQLDEKGPYSWIKTPRWRGNMMEVGPLARVLIGYHGKHGNTVDVVDDVCARLKMPVSGLQSTMGRILTRAMEARWAAETMETQYKRLISNIKNGQTAVVNMSKWEPSSWPKECRGIGFTEAPRGALGHWIVIKDQRIERYQCVVPTTWNAAPRSASGLLGPYEAALMNTKMDIPEQPLEILRTLHSFDPCLACSTHILTPDGGSITVRVD